MKETKKKRNKQRLKGVGFKAEYCQKQRRQRKQKEEKEKEKKKKSR